jgi:hypothetical protein
MVSKMQEKNSWFTTELDLVGGSKSMFKRLLGAVTKNLRKAIRAKI